LLTPAGQGLLRHVSLIWPARTVLKHNLAAGELDANRS
jgi:hypothetical protein